MKRLLPVLLAVLMLLSCSNPLMDGQNSHVNIFIYPYLEFTEEENEVAVSVVEGADVSFISIPSEVMINGEAKPVTAFTGFQNPEDAEKLTALYIPAAVTIKEGALSNSPNLAKIELTDVCEGAVWPDLPAPQAPLGQHFVGWFAGESEINPGDTVDPYNAKIIAVFEKHTLTFHEEVNSTCLVQGHEAYYECTAEFCGKLYLDAAGINETNLESISRPLSDHVYTGNWESDALSHWKRCPVCNNEIEKSKHEPGEWADCGTCWERSCTICGYKETDNHVTHRLVHFEKIEPTCTEDGNIEYWKCSVCGNCYIDAQADKKITENETILAKLNHEWKTEYANNETHHWKECIRCDEQTEYEEHDWWYVFSSDGNKVSVDISCSKCEYTNSEQPPFSGVFDVSLVYGDIEVTRLTANSWKLGISEGAKSEYSSCIWTNYKGEEICSSSDIGFGPIEVTLNSSVDADLLIMCTLTKTDGTTVTWYVQVSA